MINWMLEVEDVEDVACSVDDIEVKGRSGYFASEGMERGRGDKDRCPRCKAVETPTGGGSHYGIWSRLYINY